MNQFNSTDWWRDQLIISVADFLGNPSDAYDAKITSLLKAYQRHYQDRQASPIEDEHERAMDYR